MALLALIFAATAQDAGAQFGVPWTRSPRVTIVANGDDPRIGMVYDAVAFWNTTLEETGSGFRIGAVTRVDQPILESALQQASRAVVGSAGRTLPPMPEVLGDVPGDLVVFLASTEFVSFAAPSDGTPFRRHPRPGVSSPRPSVACVTPKRPAARAIATHGEMLALDQARGTYR